MVIFQFFPFFFLNFINLLILLGTPKHSADLVGLTSSVGTRTSTSVVQWYPGDNGLFVSSGADGQLKVWDANVLSTPVETFALGKRIYCHHISGINPSCVAVGTETNHVRIGIRTQCLKIAKKVALNIASEASYVYILSGQNFIKNVKNDPLWRILKTWILRSNSVTRQVTFNRT